MTKFSFDYRGYHVIVNPVVDNIIEAYCDSENDKVLFRIDYREEFEYKDKLIEFIKYSIDLRKNILHKQILSHLYQAALNPINNVYATFRTGASEKITDDYKVIEKDLEILENVKSKTLLSYSARRKIAEKYLKWCKDSNVMISDATNMITWLLCFKLKEWLENDK